MNTTSDRMVVLTPKGCRRLDLGYYWIYRSDLAHIPEGLSAGPVLVARGKKPRPCAYALYSPASKISLRICRHLNKNRDHGPAEEVLGAAWLHARLQKAQALRQRLNISDSAYRLVYAESDGLPSVIVDRYGDCLSVQTLSAGAETFKEMLFDELLQMFQPRAIVERNDSKVRSYEGLQPTKGVVRGELEGRVEATMNGLKFAVDLINGQKTGAFLDQRENWARAQAVAAGSALDLFSYNGGFAMSMAPKARHVLAVDSSEEALKTLHQNLRLNNIDNVETVAVNSFDLLRELDLRKEKFDTIVLDPPSFIKNKKSFTDGLRGYKEINLRAMRCLNEGGILVSCSCSYHLSREEMIAMLQVASTDAGKELKILEVRGAAPDHPEHIGVPESAYLKCVIGVVE